MKLPEDIPRPDFSSLKEEESRSDSTKTVVKTVSKLGKRTIGKLSSAPVCPAAPKKVRPQNYSALGMQPTNLKDKFDACDPKITKNYLNILSKRIVTGTCASEAAPLGLYLR